MKRSLRSLIFSALVLAMIAAFWPAEAYAQRGRAVRRTSPPRVVRTVTVARPYYYSPFYSRYYWGWSPYGWYPAYYGYYGYQRYPYPYRYYDEASLRIDVEPKDAQVYVDGYFVGEVDAFDGLFQRLHIPPGNHTLEIYLDGYRTIREDMYFQPREGYKIERRMQPLAPGDPPAVKPVPDPSRAAERDERRDDPYFDREPRDPRDRDPRERADMPIDAGAVAIRVQPAGATVLIDGEKWDGPAGPERLVVHLGEGTHRIEIQKDGYRPFVTEVRVRRGETVPLNVNLRR